MKLKDFSGEINAIMEKHTPAGGDLSMAVDMFLSNIRNAGDPEAQYDYTVGTDFDYAALKPHLKELQESKADFLGE